MNIVILLLLPDDLPDDDLGGLKGYDKGVNRQLVTDESVIEVALEGKGPDGYAIYYKD